MLFGKYPYHSQDDILKSFNLERIHLDKKELCISLASRDFLIRTLVDGIDI
jgi:hypothetical protein